MVTVEYTIASDNDDGFASHGVGVTPNGNYIVIGMPDYDKFRSGWFRFTGVTIPRYVNITSAVYIGVR